ncbi:hypothetical protein BMS3Abin17_01297 [archaeon BMS3Abin17]|nr:hypothetical protein BMS3Abin17_01297 [archaeon BMS3Abin17]HDZ60689.1 hypothetical protein [Candidatus Pacearchaeota archaeon]
MGGNINLPTRKVKSILVVQIPKFIFGSRVVIQAHDIKRVIRGKDLCDGHECDQTEAKGDVKFFTRKIDISNV